MSEDASIVQPEFLIGMHFEFPTLPPRLEGAPEPQLHFFPRGNYAGADILQHWINSELERSGLITTPGEIWGQLSNCSGWWVVSGIGSALQLLKRTVCKFHPVDNNRDYVC